MNTILKAVVIFCIIWQCQSMPYGTFLNKCAITLNELDINELKALIEQAKNAQNKQELSKETELDPSVGIDPIPRSFQEHHPAEEEHTSIQSEEKVPQKLDTLIDEKQTPKKSEKHHLEKGYTTVPSDVIVPLKKGTPNEQKTSSTPVKSEVIVPQKSNTSVSKKQTKEHHTPVQSKVVVPQKSKIPVGEKQKPTREHHLGNGYIPVQSQEIVPLNKVKLDVKEQKPSIIREHHMPVKSEVVGSQRSKTPVSEKQKPTTEHHLVKEYIPVQSEVVGSQKSKIPVSKKQKPTTEHHLGKEHTPVLSEVTVTQRSKIPVGENHKTTTEHHFVKEHTPVQSEVAVPQKSKTPGEKQTPKSIEEHHPETKQKPKSNREHRPKKVDKHKDNEQQHTLVSPEETVPQKSVELEEQEPKSIREQQLKKVDKHKDNEQQHTLVSSQETVPQKSDEHKEQVSNSSEEHQELDSNADEPSESSEEVVNTNYETEPMYQITENIPEISTNVETIHTYISPESTTIDTVSLSKETVEVPEARKTHVHISKMVNGLGSTIDYDFEPKETEETYHNIQHSISNFDEAGTPIDLPETLIENDSDLSASAEFADPSKKLLNKIKNHKTDSNAMDLMLADMLSLIEENKKLRSQCAIEPTRGSVVFPPERELPSYAVRNPKYPPERYWM